MAKSYLDILNNLSNPDAGVATAAPASPSLPSGDVDVERFRSVASQMQSAANASIKQEVERIIALPIIGEPTEEEIDLVSKYYCPKGTWRFFPEQVKAIVSYHDYGGLVCPVAVGGGKTMISVLIANEAYSVFGKRKILLMNPTNLVNQLKMTELPLYRRHISINVPFYWLAGENASKRMLMAKSKRAGCYVVSYSLLSQRDGAQLLDAIEPDLIIGDEIHDIASANPSARGRRFKETIKKFNPQIVGLSGTITKKSPRDYHTLVVAALQERAFLPRPAMLAEEWAKIIDTNAANVDEYNQNTAPQPGPIKPLIEWAKKNYPEEQFPSNLIGFRAAYNRRLETCPGVVSSGGDKLGVSLRISNVRFEKGECESRPGWDTLRHLVDKLVNEWVAPNGDELEHAMHIWRWRYELEGFGFYNDLYWPEVETIAKKRGIAKEVANEYLERSLYHYELHQEYSKTLRSWITRRAKKGLDTPFLIGRDMHENGPANVGKELFDAWRIMKEAEFPEIVERERNIVRVCDFRLKQVIKWAKEFAGGNDGEGALIWYHNRGVGQWLKEAFHEAGLPYVYCPSGPQYNAIIEDKANGGKFCIASLTAHNKGHNLQHWYNSFAAQWPRDAAVAEQFMGRTHRNGQMRDTVNVVTSLTSEFDKVLFAACLNDSAYIHQTTPTKQKLIYADYDERPELVPYAVLQQWGCQPLQATEESRRLLADKFSVEAE